MGSLILYVISKHYKGLRKLHPIQKKWKDHAVDDYYMECSEQAKVDVRRHSEWIQAGTPPDQV